MAPPQRSRVLSRPQFLFVDVQKADEPEVRKKVHSHVMHECARQRRIRRDRYLERTVKFPQNTAKVPQVVSKISLRDKSGSQNIIVPVLDASQNEGAARPPDHAPRNLHQGETTQDAKRACVQGEKELLKVVTRLASPITALSTFRRDSFSAYPVELDQDDHILVDLWMSDFPKMIQLDLSPSIERIFTPTLNVFFPLAMLSPAAFEATVLHFAALYRASLRHIKNDRHAIHHRTKALTMTQDRINAIHHGDPTTDADLVAALSLATAEYRFGSREAASIHLQGARQLVRCQRELGCQPHNPKLDLLWNWFRINTAVRGHSAEPSPRVFGELQSDFETLIMWLDNFHRRAVLHHSSDLKLAALHHNPVLCRTLAGPASDDVRYVKFEYQICRFVVLLHINMALWFYRADVAMTELYLKHLARRIVDLDLEFDPNPLFLLGWSIISDPVLHDSTRCWIVTRLSVTFRQLGLESRHRVSDFVLALLVLHDDEEGGLLIPDLDKMQLEKEVLRCRGESKPKECQWGGQPRL